METVSLYQPGAAPMRARNPVTAARDVLSRAQWDGSLPVNPAQLARNLGLEISGLDKPGFSGWYHRDRQLIEYDCSEARVRQRFTIAHELGHYALGHPTSPRDNTDAFSVRVQSPDERAANQFAAELLMPADVLRKIVQSGRARSVDQLATVFDVSKVAMAYRLNNLQLSY